MKSATLAEHRAITKALAESAEAHRHNGEKCKPACEELREMRAALRKRKKDEATWFDPPADAGSLF